MFATNATAIEQSPGFPEKEKETKKEQKNRDRDVSRAL